MLRNSHPAQNLLALLANGDALDSRTKRCNPPSATDDTSQPLFFVDTQGNCGDTETVGADAAGEADVKELAGWMCDILEDLNNEELIAQVREKVKAVCAKHPVYGK